MSTANRGGLATKEWVVLNALSDSIVTREYSGAGQMRTVMMLAPRATGLTPSVKTTAPVSRKVRRFMAFFLKDNPAIGRPSAYGLGG